MKKTLAYFLVALALVGGYGAHAASDTSPANWMVRRGIDKITQQERCLLESKKETIHDGHDDVPIYLVLTGDALLVVTESNVDLSYPGIGLKVDKHEPIQIERSFKATMVVFDSDIAMIIERFMKGHWATVSLGFWPTWPQTETFSTKFTLIGFTRAYEDFLACARR